VWLGNHVKHCLKIAGTNSFGILWTGFTIIKSCCFMEVLISQKWLSILERKRVGLIAMTRPL
jgi:hypothetical protein